MRRLRPETQPRRRLAVWLMLRLRRLRAMVAVAVTSRMLCRLRARLLQPTRPRLLSMRLR